MKIVPVQSCVTNLWDPGAALTYLAEALGEYNPACLAFALAAVAQANGIVLVAVYPQPDNENAPGGAFGAFGRSNDEGG